MNINSSYYKKSLNPSSQCDISSSTKILSYWISTGSTPKIVIGSTKDTLDGYSEIQRYDSSYRFITQVDCSPITNTQIIYLDIYLPFSCEGDDTQYEDKYSQAFDTTIILANFVGTVGTMRIHIPIVSSYETQGMDTETIINDSAWKYRYSTSLSLLGGVPNIITVSGVATLDVYNTLSDTHGQSIRAMCLSTKSTGTPVYNTFSVS